MNIIASQTFADKLMSYQGFSGKDGDLSSAIMRTINDLLTGATNVPAGNDVDATSVDQKAATASVQSALQSLYNRQGAGSISIAIVGEDHSNATDQNRATTLIAAAQNGTINPTVLAFERGMTYGVGGLGQPIVRESNLTQPATNPNAWQGLSAAQRSRVVAGYLALILAGGDQNSIDRVLVFFGANHFDIVQNDFDYFARHSDAAYLLKRARTFMTIRSNA